MKRSVVAATLTAVLIAAGCATERPPRAPALTGAWRSSITFQSGAFAEVKDLEFLYVFNEGGTLTESSNYDAAPPVAPAYGVWRAVGDSGRQFEAHYEFFVTTPTPPEEFKSGAGWTPAGRGVFTELMTVSDDGRTFASSIVYEAFDAQGKPVAGGGEASGRGKRIEFR